MYTYFFVLFKFLNFIPSQYINIADSMNISGEGRISSVQALANWFFWGALIVKIMYAKSFRMNAVNKHIPSLFVL